MFHRGRYGGGQDRGSGVRGGRAGLTGHAGKRWRRPAEGAGMVWAEHGLAWNQLHDQNPPGKPETFPESLAGERTTLRLGTTGPVRTVLLAGLRGSPRFAPSLGSHLQDLGAAERDVRVEGEGLIRHQSQAGVAPGEFGHRDLRL